MGAEACAALSVAAAALGLGVLALSLGSIGQERRLRRLERQVEQLGEWTRGVEAWGFTSGAPGDNGEGGCEGCRLDDLA